MPRFQRDWKWGASDVRELFDSVYRGYAIGSLHFYRRHAPADRQILVRTNRTGKSLDWPTVHKALFGQEKGRPSTLTDLQEKLVGVGMGRLPEERLLTALMSLRGLDPTRGLDEHSRRDPGALRDAVQQGLPVLRRALSFLRRDAEVLHVFLLPSRTLLDVLTRFFALHPEPSVRTRLLLSRWFWRTALGAGAVDGRTLRRRGIRSIEEDDEEASVQRLLSLVDRSRQRPFELPASFDGRADDNRIVLCALAHLEPRHLETGQPLDVAALLEAQDVKAFAKIVKRSGVEGSRGPANRILQPKGTAVAKPLQQHDTSIFDRSSIPASHVISPEALGCLARNDLEGFLVERAVTLTVAVRKFDARMAAWEHSDRPSVEYLLREAEAVAS